MELEQLQEQVSRLKSELESLKILFNKGNFSSTQYFTQSILLDKTAKIKFGLNTGSSPITLGRNTEDLVFESPQDSGGNAIQFGSDTIWTSVIMNVDNQFLVNNGTNSFYVGASTVDIDSSVNAGLDKTVTAGGAKIINLGSTGISLVVGSGAPTLSAPKGSLYLRTDGSSTSTRAYVNTDGGTTWTSITTAS